MSKRKLKPKHISQEAWDAVESPPLSDERLSKLRPASEVGPEAVEAFRRTRGPQKEHTKERISIRLDKDVLEYFRKTGRGWQTRINEALKAHISG
ncbi:MAG: BrnA antitoxin family protein [Hyphomicrobiales bacterium]|nr:BrnA antitoxin family protein [Hyphomicrobiales bacterium]